MHSPQLHRPSPELGARVGPRGVAYHAWAPDHPDLRVEITQRGRRRTLGLERDADGYWHGFDPDGRAGDRYYFVLPDGTRVPDVASRFQPDGVHGASECIDASAFPWREENWRQPRWRGQVIYEMHLGTFTPEGTFRAAIERLPHIRDLGAEAVELMPVADFPGARNWGYDGVALYAPARCYGRPDDFRALVDAAHELGLAVILDVVYNHVGPAGNYLPRYCASYFHATRATPWGSPFDFDGPRSRAVRDFVTGNALYWLDEFRIDGLRLDATHAIPDESRTHVLQEIATAVHQKGGFVIAEDERNNTELLRQPAGGGYGLDAVWSDDFHHQARVAVTGIRESYFAAYGGTPDDVAATLEHGWSYRGQPYPFWQGRPRGAPCDHLPTSAFIFCLENHDQVGNRAKGERLEHLIIPAQFRAASMLLCLAPYAPMIFMGQEWAATSPFLFFTDHAGEHGRQVSAGRLKEFEHRGLNAGISDVPDPQDDATFLASKPPWDEIAEPGHAGVLALYRECLRERRTWLKDEALNRDRWSVHVAGDWIGVRYRLPEGEHMLLLALHDSPSLGDRWPENLAPPRGHCWHTVLHSEAPGFGGERPALFQPGDLTGPAAAWLLAVAEEGDAAN